MPVMQPNKLLIVFTLCFAVAVTCFYSIPVERSYNVEIDINSNNIITYRTLMDAGNWSKWYSANRLAPDSSQLTFQRDQNYKRFDYWIRPNTNTVREGQVRVTKSNRWNTKIRWVEKVTLDKGLKSKLKLIFKGADNRNAFLQTVLQFKSFVEHPEDSYGGLTFKRTKIPASKLVTLSDTFAYSQLPTRLPELYASLLEKLGTTDVKSTGEYFSQHEMLNDSLAQVRLGVVVTDDLHQVKAPLDLLDMDEYQAIVMQVDNNYATMNEDISVMYEWLKKNESRPAAGFWIRHHTSNNVARTTTPERLTIIQEFYSIK